MATEKAATSNNGTIVEEKKRERDFPLAHSLLLLLFGAHTLTMVCVRAVAENSC